VVARCHEENACCLLVADVERRAGVPEGSGCTRPKDSAVVDVCSSVGLICPAGMSCLCRIYRQGLIVGCIGGVYL